MKNDRQKINTKMYNTRTNYKAYICKNKNI